MIQNCLKNRGGGTCCCMQKNTVRGKMTESGSKFQKQILDIAVCITRAKSGDAIDLASLWQAYLYLAHTDNEDARRTLSERFGKKSWEGKFPENIGKAVSESLPVDSDVKRMMGPLSPLSKKYGGRLTPENFLAVLEDTKLLARLDMPEVWTKNGLKAESPDHPVGTATPPSAGLPDSASHKKRTPSGEKHIINTPVSTKPPKVAAAIGELQNRLETRVFGQTSALRAFVDGLRTALDRPVRKGSLGGSFLICGPNGCGKGEMIRILEEWVAEYGNLLRNKKVVYCEGYLHNILPTLRQMIRGAEPSIIVLSEFEKYETMVRDVLMEGMDRAVLQLPDRHISGKLLATDIKGSIIIFIGNVGRALWGRLPFKETEMLPDRERIKEILEEEALIDHHFKSSVFERRLSRSFLDRIDNFIPFCHLRYADVSKILEREIVLFQEELAAGGIRLEVEPRVKDLIVLASFYKRGRSGRQAVRGFREFIENRVRGALQKSGRKKLKLVCIDKVFNKALIQSKPRVLVIDDEWEIVCRTFQEGGAEEMEVIGVPDITKALECSAREPFDLVLLDLYFDSEPLWKEYLSAWRSAQPETPVVLFSGKFVSSADRLEIDRMGGVLGFLEKNPDPEEAARSLDPFFDHASWQAKIRAFENQYGHGGDRIVFDTRVREEIDTLVLSFIEVQGVVSERSAAVEEEPVLPAETRLEIEEFLDIFLNARKRVQFQIKRPKGLLLYGPPGNGKTMIARHIAQGMRCNFIAVAAGDFQSRWAGVAAERLKETFELARVRQPCVVFIDEIDALAPPRTESAGSGLLRDQAATVATLLTELDGFHEGHDLFLVAATNRKEAVDPALVRPGRLDRAIEVSPPGLKERRELITRSVSQIPGWSFDLEWGSSETYGLSCAQIVRAVQDSVLIALRRTQNKRQKAFVDKVEVTKDDLREAIDRLRYGAVPAKGSIKEKTIRESREIRAWHEAGHMMASLTLLNEIPDRATIVPRADFGGYIRSTEESFARRLTFRRRTSCIAELGVIVAGGLAEEMKFGEHSAGVGDDRLKALQLAHAMVVRWGMGPLEAEVQGFLAGGSDASSGDPLAPSGASPTDQNAVTKAVSELVMEATERAAGALERCRDDLERAARLLLETEELDRLDIEREFAALVNSAQNRRALK